MTGANRRGEGETGPTSPSSPETKQATDSTLTLEWLPGRYAVCRLEPHEPIPAWVASEGPHVLLSITRTDRELSIVIDQDRVPPGVKAQRNFAAMRIVGTLDFSLTGVIARLTTPLAAAGVPVFVVSTFETDVVMVRADDAARIGPILTEVAVFAE